MNIWICFSHIDDERYLFTEYLSDSVAFNAFDLLEAYSLENSIFVYLEKPVEGTYVYYPQFVFVGTNAGTYVKKGEGFSYVGDERGGYLPGYLQKETPDLNLISLNYAGSENGFDWNIDFSSW